MKIKTYPLKQFWTANIVLTFVVLSLLSVSFIYNYKNFHKTTVHGSGFTTYRAADISIPFIENTGQINENVLYFADLLDGTFFIDKTGTLTYSYPMDKGGYAIKESLVGGNILNINPSGQSETKINYFVGNKENWRTHIASYQTLDFGEIYPGINLNLNAYKENIEKVFTVSPDADPSKIRLQIRGADKLTVTLSDQLEITTPEGSIKMTKPYGYQNINGYKKNIDVKYNLISPDTYGFSVGNYDHGYPLIIDPILASTFIGGSDWEAAGGFASNMTLDPGGNVFMSGISQSSDFPATPGAFDETYGVDRDGIIVKFNPALSTLQSATFLGGNSADDIAGIDIDSSGNVYVTGQTQSTDFPTTLGAYDENDGDDNIPTQAEIYVSKFSNDLSVLSASTFLGGDGWDRSHSISVMPTSPEKVVIGGFSMSTDFPIADSGTAFDSTLGNEMDAVLAVFNLGLDTLEASTYIGNSTPVSGTGNERIMSVDTTPAGIIYALGRTNETDFPANTLYTTYGGGTFDGFVARFQSDLSTTNSYLTYIGGDGDEFPNNIIVSGSEIFIGGRTTAHIATPYPTTTGAYDQTMDGGQEAFVSSLDLTLSTLNASTFFGGSGSSTNWSGDTGYALMVDSTGTYVYLGGQTDSADLPVTSGTYDSSLSSTNNSYIAKLPASLDSLAAATYLGGCGNDRLTVIYEDPADNDIYLSGWTQSTDFHTLSTSYDNTHNGINDYFVSKIDNNLTAGIPGKVTEMTATPGTNSVTLDWCPPPGDATGYTVNYGTTASGLFDQTCGTPSCTDGTAGATVYNLTNEEYQFKIFAENASGTGDESNVAAATPLDPCSGLGTNQFCATQQISEYVLTFLEIPDSVNFGTITSGTTIDVCNNTSTLASPANICSDNTIPDPPGADDALSVRDERNSGGFVVQVTTQGSFISGTDSIPLDNLYIISTIDEADPYKAGGINYSDPFTGPKTVLPPVYVNENSSDISDPDTYKTGWSNQAPPYESLLITQFSGNPLDLMDGTLSSTEGRIGDMSLFTNFNLTNDALQAPGDYALILTYDLIDSTTP